MHPGGDLRIAHPRVTSSPCMHPPPGVPAGPQLAKVQEMLRNAALSLAAVATITTSGAALPDLVRHHLRDSPALLPPLAYWQLPDGFEHRVEGSSSEGVSVKPVIKHETSPCMLEPHAALARTTCVV